MSYYKLKIGTNAIKPSVHCSIRDVINCSSFWSIDALEIISQLQPKEGCIHDDVQACTMSSHLSIMGNRPRHRSHKWICKPLKKGLLDHHEQKQRLVKKNEKPYIAWRVLATLEQHSKHLPSQTSGWQKEPVH